MILGATLASESVGSLQEFTMENSCDFSSDVSCDYLAQLLATGQNLDEVNVSGQIGERKIDV